MCDTDAERSKERQYELKINDMSAGTSRKVGESKGYSTKTDSTLYIMPIIFSLNKPYNSLNIKPQAPSGGSAPNFITMTIMTIQQLPNTSIDYKNETLTTDTTMQYLHGEDRLYGQYECCSQ